MTIDETRNLPAALTVAEAAPLLRVSERHLRELLRRGEVPSLRLGRRVVIPTARLLRELGIEETTNER